MKSIRLVSVLVMSVMVLSACGSSLPSDVRADLAQCVTDAGWTMYGTSWCSHCKTQKSLFGEAFGYISYVDCDMQSDICAAAAVGGYPTRINQNGERASGTQELSSLAELAGCSDILGE